MNNNHFTIKVIDILFAFLISIGFLEFFVGKLTDCFILLLMLFAIICLFVTVIYKSIGCYLKTNILINEKFSDMFFNVAVTVASFTLLKADNNCDGWKATFLFLSAGFICLYINNILSFIKSRKNK